MFLKGNHKELKGSLETVGAGVALFEVSTAENNFFLVTANSAFEQVIEKSVSACIHAKTEEIFARYIVLPLKECFWECYNIQESTEREIVIDSKGQSHWWRFIVSPILATTKDSTSRLMVTCIEITDKKLLEKQLEDVGQRFEAVVETAYDGIITIDEQQNIKLMNGAAKQIFQITDQDVTGLPLTSVIPQRYRSIHTRYVDGFRDSTIDARPMASSAAVIGMRNDGTEFPLEVAISKINVGGKIEMTAVIRDISERARLMDELSKAAIEDELTGLPNRRCFERDFRKELLRCSRFNTALSLIIIDIDDFKAVNDSYGHLCGDSILRDFSQILKDNIREIDSLARWGGEEFAVLLPATDGEGAALWANRVRAVVEQYAFRYGDQTIHLTASFGISCSNHIQYTEDMLFEKADKNLYQAKASGKNRVVN